MHSTTQPKPKLGCDRLSSATGCGLVIISHLPVAGLVFCWRYLIGKYVPCTRREVVDTKGRSGVGDGGLEGGVGGGGVQLRGVARL